MSQMIDKDEIYKSCIEKASEMIKLLVDNFEEKYLREPVVRSVTLHLAQLYYLVETNHNFQRESEEMAIKTEQLLKGLSMYKGNQIDMEGESLKL